MNRNHQKSVALLFTNIEAYRTAKKVVADNGRPYKVYFSSLDEAADFALKELDPSTEILISRGGVASLLQSILSIPVVKVKYAFSDFAISLETALQYSPKVAIVSFEQGIKYAKNIQSFLRSGVEMVQINSASEFPAALELLRKKGIEVLIGGYSTGEYAKRMGLKYVPVTANPGSMLDAIEEAEKILESLHEKEEKAQLISSILDCCTTAIIALDKDGTVTNINSLAKRYLNCSDGDLLGKKYKSIFGNERIIIDALGGKASFQQLLTYQNEIFAANCLPITVGDEVHGAVLNLQGSSEIHTMESNLRKRIANGYSAKNSFDDIIGQSRVLLDAKKKALTYAPVDSTVMIYGESGVGKELFAQSIHNNSLRRNQPFVAINCAALPESLLESELFGYVKGAFTGARSEGKAGIFELAHNGTIFLDEIGEMSVALQARLLRVIQEKEIMRLGDSKVISVNVRVLAATNKNLLEEIKKGNFREDLYYRLCVLVLRLPPLRERKEDIPELVQHFTKHYSIKYSRNIDYVSPEALELLQKFSYPGNIREFSNLIERTIVLSHRKFIGVEEVQRALNEEFSNYIHTDTEPSVDPEILMINDEKSRLLDALLKADGNREKAAKLLGICRTTLWKKLKEYDIK